MAMLTSRICLPLRCSSSSSSSSSSIYQIYSDSPRAYNNWIRRQRSMMAIAAATASRCSVRASSALGEKNGVLEEEGEEKEECKQEEDSDNDYELNQSPSNGASSASFLEDEGDIKVECDESGCALVIPNGKTLHHFNARKAPHLRCDLKGCYYVEEPAKKKKFEVVEGKGWHVGYETSPESEESFCAALGARGWSIALTASEFDDFCHLIQSLHKSISTMDEDGVLDKDNITMQVERGNVWMECNIPKKKVAFLQNLWKFGSKGHLDKHQETEFELRFILMGDNGRRQVEGYWPTEAVTDMLKKIDGITLEQRDRQENLEGNLMKLDATTVFSI